MKIVLASTSPVKVNACKKAFADIAGAEIIPVKAASGVAEQPLNDETLTGAFNRIRAVQRQITDADLYVSIENGLFEENGSFIDRAVVVIAAKGRPPAIAFSEGVEFPKASVEETRKRGFDKWTAGKVMQEQGIIRQHDDPHADLGGKSRAAYIDDAMRAAVSALKL